MRYLTLILLVLSASSTAACVIDAVSVPDAPLSYAVITAGEEARTVTVQVRCNRPQDRYRLLLSGGVRFGPGDWEAELQPPRGGGEPLRVTLQGAAQLFGPGVSFGGDVPDASGPRTYTHTLTLRVPQGQWVAGGSYLSNLRVNLHDL